MTPRRIVRTFVACATAAIVVACGRGADHRYSSGGNVTPDLPGALPANIDSMSGADFRDFARHLHFAGGGDFKRPCSGVPHCDGTAPRDTTVVSINAVRGQDSLPIATLPATGAIAAELVNKGPFAERMLALKSDSSKFRYYLIVYPGSSDSLGTWRLEELETHGNTASHRSIGTGKFHGCNHRFDPNGPRAAFKSCAEAERVHEHMLMRASNAPQGFTSPPWVSCILGCCSAEGN